MQKRLTLCVAYSVLAISHSWAAGLTSAELLNAMADSIDRAAYDRGEIVWTSLADRESKRELVGAMLVQLSAPMSKVVQSMQSDTSMQSSASVPIDKPEDWTAVTAAIKPRLTVKELERLADEDAADDFNLSAAELVKLKGAKDVTQLAAAWSSVLQARAKSYQSKGTAGLAPYVKEDKSQIHPGKQLDEATASMDFLRQNYPRFIDSVTKFPTVIAGLSQRNFFNIEEEDGRPLFVLKNRLIRMETDHTLIAERQYYISHTLDTLQVTILFLPTEKGTLMVLLNQTFTGKVAPAVGSAIAHRVGRGKVQDKIRPMFESMQKKFPMGTK